MPQGEIFSERRKHKRAEKRLKVIYKQMAKEDDDAPGKVVQEKKAGLSEDISISGLQLICDEKLPAEQMLRIDIVITEGDEPMTTFAEVRWSREDTKLKKFRTGLEFLVIKEDHIETIRKLIGA